MSLDSCLRWMLYTLKKTVETVLESGNHILVQLKRNQPSLHDAVAQHAHNQAPAETHTLHDSGKRNRIEMRVASVWTLPAGVGTEPWHDHFKTLVCVHRQTDRFDTRTHDWETSKETAYYLCDCNLSAEQANHVIRQHWGVENKIHYVRDTRLNEDASRIRCNPGIFALFCSFALNKKIIPL